MERPHKKTRSLAGRLNLRLVLRLAAMFALLDVVFFVVASLWLDAYLNPFRIRFILLVTVAAEGVVLVLIALQNAGIIKRTLKPLTDLSAAAARISDRGDLSSLAVSLDRIDAGTLDTRLPVEGPAELRELTRAINALLERLDAAYAAQNRFVSDASHELRTPIAVILGYARMLDRWGKDDPAARQEAIDAIQAEAGSMQSLIEQLLFLARGDNSVARTEMREVELTELAAQVLKETAMLDQTHPLAADWSEPVTAVADPELVKEALRVLVDNAVKYTPPGGRVTVRVRDLGEQVALSVSDEGPGIDREDLPRLFERFYRADASRARQTGGTGLGLPIAHQIARCHNGHIQVQTVKGLGTRFTLLLPKTPA